MNTHPPTWLNNPPTQVLFNHSCCPNTLRINRGRVSYMVAKHTIMPGEEVIVST